jgi:GntP family gluconate:H+ symporter
MLPLAFFVTALVRTSQGSATVAMITSVGILGPLAQSMELGFHPVYLALAIGCGSKPIPWMADSGFWIVCKMSGMTEKETLKTFSPLLTLMGLVGLPILMIASKLFPLTG